MVCTLPCILCAQFKAKQIRPSPYPDGGQGVQPKKKEEKKRFRYEECWLLEEDYKRIIETGWEEATGGVPVSMIRNKITNTRFALMEWSTSRFGNLKEEIEKTRAQLAFFFDNSYSAPPNDDRLALEDKLNSLLHQEHAFWLQRAKVFWLMDGDLNTKFFHRCATNRKRKNQLKGIFDENGVWCNTDDEMERIILQYFGELFSSSQPTNIAATVNHLPEIISAEMNLALTKQVTMDEVHFSLNQMHPSKAPGPDGFSPCFYQQCWSLVGLM